MAGLDDYSITAGSNPTIAGIDVDENCAPSGINNAIRQLMADVRRAFNDIGAKAVSAGTDTVTLTTETVYAAYADGTALGFIAGGTNTGAATLNVDGVGAKAIRKGGDAALAAGDIVAGMPVLVFYDASANTAAGAWMLINPQTISGYQPLDADLTALAALSTTGMVARTAANTYVPRTIAGTSNEVTVTNGDGVSGAPTIALHSGVYRASGTDVALADGGTGASLADPGADRIFFWDDSAGVVDWLIAGTGLTITDKTIAVSGSSGQPTPSSSTLAVGSLAFCMYTSATAVTDGNTSAGSNLELVAGQSSVAFPSDATENRGAVQTGTWRNDSGATQDTDSGGSNAKTGYWTRTA